MKIQLTLLACLLGAPLVQAETAVVRYDHSEGHYAYFSNNPTFMVPSGGSYAYVPYLNEGWQVLDFTTSNGGSYILSVGNQGWTKVRDPNSNFEFEYRIAYTGTKLYDWKSDVWDNGKLTTYGCAARTKDGNEYGEAAEVFSRQNSYPDQNNMQRVNYWSVTQTKGSSYYVACDPKHVGTHATKDTKVIENHLALEFRINRIFQASVPDYVVIPEDIHLIRRYAAGQTGGEPLKGRDIKINIDKSRYPMVFEVKRTPYSDISVFYNKIRDGKKTITKESLFKIDVMVGGWWTGGLTITPTCSGDKMLCDSISKLTFDDVAKHFNREFSTTLNKPIVMLNAANDVQVNDRDWKVKIDFDNLHKIPAMKTKRSARVTYQFEAKI